MPAQGQDPGEVGELLPGLVRRPVPASRLLGDRERHVLLQDRPCRPIPSPTGPGQGREFR